MSANLELMQKIAWTNKHPRKKPVIIIESTPNGSPNPWYQAIKCEPRNFCDDDLDKIFNPRDWWEDTWWKPA